jgi:hypothetical protein
MFVTTFVVLLILIMVFPRARLSYARNVFGDAARERDDCDPSRKRSLALDLLGCAGLGILMVIMLGLLVAHGSSLGH